MGRMDKIPVFLRKTVFEKVFSIAEYVNMTQEEKSMYNAALKRKWDNAAVLDYAVQTAKEEGIKEERARAEAEKREILLKAEAKERETVLALHGMGMQLADIAKAMGLSLEKVEQLLVG
jgi:DNA-directed RNA polymerase specialized sigma24 family protein